MSDHEDLTREDLIDAAREAAEEVDGPMSRADFERVTGISQYHIYKLFPDGGWTEVLSGAGLDPHPRYNPGLDDLQLLEAYHSVVQRLGDIPSWHRFNAEADISADVVRKRFGGLQGILKRYREWLEENHPDSTAFELVQARSRHEVPPPPASDVDLSDGDLTEWSKSSGVEYGGPIDFRGLRHAPINEQGVVYLFGMVSYELGYIVEAIHSSFPDCEAKRCIDQRRNRWQRVRIEFEYRSRNFRDHGHDPEQCDLIVCWEHDWPECPLEVIELRRVIDRLEG